MTDDEERVVVKTYVPRSQKERWVEHADALGMSQSEFLRSMVQAGRRGFDPDPEESDTADATPGGETLEDRVRAAVADAGVLGWEALVDRLVGDVERDLDEALGRLQDAGRVRYSGREGGYVLAGAADEAPGDGRREGGTERGPPGDGRRDHGGGRRRDDERPDDRRRSEPRDDGRGPPRERRPSGRRDDPGEDHRGGRRRERPPDGDRRAPTRRAGRRPRYDDAESRPADDYEDEGRRRRADGRDEEGRREREDRREGDSRRDGRDADRRGRR